MSTGIAVDFAARSQQLTPSLVVFAAGLGRLVGLHSGRRRFFREVTGMARGFLLFAL